MNSLSTAGGPETPVLSETMQRDAVGRITARTEQVGTAGMQSFAYGYDTAGRLTSVSVDGAVTETFAYDSTGGLAARGSGVLSSLITRDGHGRPTSTTSGLAASWSTDGELATLTRPGVGQAQFSYDGLGRLKGTTLADGRVASYKYDGLGRRLSLRVDGQLVRRYVYGGGRYPTARVDAAGEVLERYVYASGAHVPDLILRRDGQKLRVLTDSLGSVRAVVDTATGAVVQRLSYDAYGQVAQDTAPGTQPFGFKGAMNDPAAEGAGLVWMGVRAYVPSLARFATPDPAGLIAGWNEHDALGGDPVNMIDPDGQLFGWVQGAINATAGVADGALSNVCLGMCNPGQWAREQVGLGGLVNTCSATYKAASFAGSFISPIPFGAAAMVGRAGIRGAQVAGRLGSKFGASRLGRRLADETGAIRISRNGEEIVRTGVADTKAVIGDLAQQQTVDANTVRKASESLIKGGAPPQGASKLHRAVHAITNLMDRLS